MTPPTVAEAPVLEASCLPMGDAPAVAACTSAGRPDASVAPSQGKPARSAGRWAAAPILAAAAYVCWVLARQVLWGVQEREPWTLLSVSVMIYLVGVAWTMVLVAVTIWTGHRAGRLFWPWALLVCAPGLVYLYHFAALNKDWGGTLGAEFYEMIALVAALAALALAGAIGVAARLAPPAGRLLARLLGRLRREPSKDSVARAVGAPAAETPSEASPDLTA
jgi:hypothetical protein